MVNWDLIDINKKQRYEVTKLTRPEGSEGDLREFQKSWVNKQYNNQKSSWHLYEAAHLGEHTTY